MHDVDLHPRSQVSDALAVIEHKPFELVQAVQETAVLCPDHYLALLADQNGSVTVSLVRSSLEKALIRSLEARRKRKAWSDAMSEADKYDDFTDDGEQSGAMSGDADPFKLD